MAPQLQSALQSSGMLPVAGPGFCSHLPVSAYILKRQACFSSASVSSSTLLPVWATLERKDVGSPAAPILLADPLPFDKTVQLPLLVSSTVIPGLPPQPPPASCSKIQETEQSLERIAERWKLQSFELQWVGTGISFTNFVHGGAVDTDRFVAISIFYTIHFMFDDIVYDAPMSWLSKCLASVAAPVRA
jgi:hypothetical protein